jgi:amidase
LIEQTNILRSGEVRPAAFRDGSLTAIEEQNATINAVPIVFEQKHLLEGLPGRPYSGVPILLKDCLCGVSGERRTEGSNWLRRINYRDNYDSAFVVRLIEAGFALLGRTNAPEFASADTTEPRSSGPTRNPWDLSRSTGGSSGGSAAAVAAGIVSAAHGTDASGSVRLPASWCGVFGFKPSRGLVASSPDFGEGWGTLGFRSCHGVLSWSVTDAAALLDVIAGNIEGSLAMTKPHSGGYSASLRQAPKGLRIGVVSPDSDWEEGVAEAVSAVGLLLETMGHLVVPAKLPELEVISELEFDDVEIGTELRALIAWWAHQTGTVPEEEDLEVATWQMLDVNPTATPVHYLTMMQSIQNSARRLAEWTQSLDVIITPTTVCTAPLLGRYASEDPLGELRRQLVHTARYTNPFSLTGQPCISVPIGHSPEGLPCGVQLVGHHGADEIVLRLAYQLEVCAPLFRPEVLVPYRQ